ncbi:hypothetical protein C9374_007647 [Naegleria lovaniensis]|uniref:Endonuclease/exonuclease/phosphatase domain-containing protein n=1 Tax=Naegleria lovaniensis TaxID=51637 RepID=A0AA88GK52_NAELO|nr:uncharacterized protein C9374_007647 [Naegleria lovaniensis]KAG2379009.1 hypothetical protein C9374_007647 [Naegleria lovaniensis]
MKLITYNMWLTALTVRVPPHKEERIEGLLNNLASQPLATDVDIVALQEMFTFGSSWLLHGNTELRDGLIQKASKIGFNHVALSNEPKFLMQDSGLMILSKHKIVDQENYIFKYASWTEYIVAKGILYALIEKNGSSSNEHDREYVMVFCLHMDAHTDSARREQIKELKQYVKTKLEKVFTERNISFHGQNSKNRVVICGDYNVNSLRSTEGSTYQLLAKEMSQVTNEVSLSNAFGEDVTKHPVTFPIKLFDDWCLDHVFVSKGSSQVNYNVLQWTTSPSKDEETPISISDHYGVCAYWD